MEYEINFLVLQSNTEKLEDARNAIKKIIEKREGKITDTLEYKKRKLAYEIKHQQYGFYTVFRFTAEGNETIEKIKRDINLLQNVARYIIIRADGLSSLKEETPLTQEKNEMASKNTIKQEEVEQILSGKKPAPKKPAMTTAKKEEVSEVKKEESPKAVAPEKVEKEKEEEKKEEVPAKEDVEPQKAAEDKKEKDDRSSLEDLDKKLDEILNG